MTVTPLQKDTKNPPELMALIQAEEITVTMKLDNYHAIQKAIAEGNFTRGQTAGQCDLIFYLYHIVVTKELSVASLVWDRLPTDAEIMLKEMLVKIGVLDAPKMS